MKEPIAKKRTVVRLTDVGGRADFCSPSKICISAILAGQMPPTSPHGSIHVVLPSELQYS